MTVGLCDGGATGATVEPSLFLEGPGHGQPHLQELRPQRQRRRLLQFVRYGHHGQHLQLLTSPSGARNFLQGNGHFRGNPDPRPPTHPVNIGFSNSPVLSVTRCNDMERSPPAGPAAAPSGCGGSGSGTSAPGSAGCAITARLSGSPEIQPQAEHPPARVELSRRCRSWGAYPGRHRAASSSLHWREPGTGSACP